MYMLLTILGHFFIAWRWGDWRNWSKYQSTFLYMITTDLTYNLLTYNYSLWEYQPTVIFPNHTLTNLTLIVIGYPSLIFIYLGRYPKKKMNQFLWITFWIFLESFLEWIALQLGVITYHNGWNFLWSVFFDVAIYVMLRLHYTKPLLTYGLSIIITVGFLIIFKVPVSTMK